MEVEGFSAARLKAVQAKLAGKGGIKLNEQVNILNLPLPDFDLEGESRRYPWHIHLCLHCCAIGLVIS